MSPWSLDRRLSWCWNICFLRVTLSQPNSLFCWPTVVCNETHFKLSWWQWHFLSSIPFVTCQNVSPALWTWNSEQDTFVRLVGVCQNRHWHWASLCLQSISVQCDDCDGGGAGDSGGFILDDDKGRSCVRQTGDHSLLHSKPECLDRVMFFCPSQVRRTRSRRKVYNLLNRRKHLGGTDLWMAPEERDNKEMSDALERNQHWEAHLIPYEKEQNE